MSSSKDNMLNKIYELREDKRELYKRVKELEMYVDTILGDVEKYTKHELENALYHLSDQLMSIGMTESEEE